MSPDAFAVCLPCWVDHHPDVWPTVVDATPQTRRCGLCGHVTLSGIDLAITLDDTGGAVTTTSDGRTG